MISLGLASLVGLGGCMVGAHHGGGGQLPGVSAQTTGDRRGQFEPIDARSLLPTTTLTGQYTFTHGDHAGSTYPYTLEKTDDGWVFLVQDQWRVFLRLGVDGELLVDREDSLHDHVRVEYEPALVILPARLGVDPGGDPGSDPLPSGQVRMTVWNLSTAQQQAAGTCDYQITHIWPSTLTTSAEPGGTYQTYTVRQERQIDLTLAQVQVTLDSSYAVGLGQVAESEWRTEQALGLFTRKVYRRIERSR